MACGTQFLGCAFEPGSSAELAGALAAMAIELKDVSNFIVRTADGLRVAVAGLPADMPVDVEGVVLDAIRVADLRTLTVLPQPLRIAIPYRLVADGRVHVTAAGEGER